MRKVLLASAAMLGFAAGAAQAATIGPMDASRNASAFGAPQTNPDPGKIIVHLGGLVAFDAAVIGTDSDNSHLNPPAAGSGAKNDRYGTAGYFRLYFGVDGKLANGLIYGAKSEMRTNFAGGTANSYSTNGAIGNASANTSASLWFTRRAYGYIGGASWGIVRVGQGDGPLSLFTGGGITTGEAYDTGQWDGDACDLVGAGCVAWGFYDIGNEYTSNKVTYISPTIAGFNLGVSFAPSSAALSGVGSNPASVGQANRQATSGNPTDLGRPRNIYEVAARWQGPIGPVSIDAMLGYAGSAVVNPTATAPLPGGVTGWRPVSVIDGGASVTFAGFSVFGHANTGQSNGTMTPEPKLASGRSKNSLTWTFGGMWSAGPWTVGSSYYVFESLGATSGIGQRYENGVSVGGIYTVTPGFDVFLEYDYGHRHQAGVNFQDPGGSPANGNNIKTNIVLTTLLFRW